MLLSLLFGCLDSLLEAPYVLTTGLSEARSITPTPRRTMMIATPQGVIEIEGSGQHHPLTDQPVLSVATHASSVYLLTDSALQWGTLPPLGERLTILSSLPVSGIVDIQSWCEQRVLLAGAKGLQVWTPATGIIEDFHAPLPPLHAVSLPAIDPCGGVVVLTEDALIEISRDGQKRHPVEHPRVATPGRDGHIWVIHGQPPVLSRLEEAGLVLRARHLGDPRDAHFGNGELFSPSNLYLADASGTLDYARVITEPP